MEEPSPARPSNPAKVTGRRRFLAWAVLRWGLILVLLMELGMRMVLGLGTLVTYQSDPDCGYLPKPNQNLTRFFCHVLINENGMRSQPVRQPKPADEFRVLFVGDSVAYGTAHVDQAKIFTSRLAHDLPERLHRPVEVLNASAGGWAVGNEVGYVRSRGVFNSDLVVFVLNSEDMVQPFDDTKPTPDNAGFPSKSPMLAFTDLWWSFLKYRASHGKITDPGAAATNSDPATDLVSCARTCGLLAEAKALSEKAGAKFAVVYSPMMQPDRKVPPFVAPWRAALGAWCDQNQVPLLDLTTAYTESPLPLNQIYMDAIHLVAGGHAVVAESIERWPVITSFDKAPKARQSR